jgi:negative regulator of sigma-B (phosphoserine phosphatase)
MAEVMDATFTRTESGVDWSVASRPMAGQTVSGDLALVKSLENRVLIAVIDGIGHGPEAAAAARAAANILEHYAAQSTISLVKRCHQALLLTRGVVLTVAKITTGENTLTWLGVGNVEGRLLRADPSAIPKSESALLRSGLVGCQLPALQASVVPIAPGDVLILATDGIEPNFEFGIRTSDSSGRIAEKILERRYKGKDDALVLVARYEGTPTPQ